MHSKGTYSNAGLMLVDFVMARIQAVTHFTQEADQESYRQQEAARQADRQQDKLRESVHQQETARDIERQHEALKLPRTIFTRDVIAQSPVTYKKYTATGNYAPRFTPLADDKWGAAWPDSIDLSNSLLITTFRRSK